MATESFTGSCYNGEFKSTGGFAAPQLSADPNVTLLGGGASAGAANGIALTLASSGRTNAGGQLHPNSGSVYYSRTKYSADEAMPYMYSNLCVEVVESPSLDDEEGVSVEFGECGTRYSDENGLQRFKFGYDWTVSYLWMLESYTPRRFSNNLMYVFQFPALCLLHFHRINRLVIS